MKNLISNKSVVLPNSQAHMNCVSVSHCVLCLMLFCCFFWFDCVWFVWSWCVPHHWQKTVEVVGWSLANRQWKWWGGHWQMTVKVVGWELAGSKGDSEKWWGGHRQRGNDNWWLGTGKSLGNWWGEYYQSRFTDHPDSQSTPTKDHHQHSRNTQNW